VKRAFCLADGNDWKANDFNALQQPALASENVVPDPDSIHVAAQYDLPLLGRRA
jgi:hypothetical protein